jgi:hypothetical protein
LDETDFYATHEIFKKTMSGNKRFRAGLLAEVTRTYATDCGENYMRKRATQELSEIIFRVEGQLLENDALCGEG